MNNQKKNNNNRFLCVPIINKHFIKNINDKGMSNAKNTNFFIKNFTNC